MSWITVKTHSERILPTGVVKFEHMYPYLTTSDSRYPLDFETLKKKCRKFIMKYPDQ